MPTTLVSKKVKMFGYDMDYRLVKLSDQLMNQWRVLFSNGYGASIIGGEYAYGDGLKTFELAVLKNGSLCYDTPITDDVLPYLTADKVAETLKKIESLPQA